MEELARMYLSLPQVMIERLQVCGFRPNRPELLAHLYDTPNDLNVLVAHLLVGHEVLEDVGHEGEFEMSLYGILMAIQAAAEVVVLQTKRRRRLLSCEERADAYLDRTDTAGRAEKLRRGDFLAQVARLAREGRWKTTRVRLLSRADESEDSAKARADVKELERLR